MTDSDMSMRKFGIFSGYTSNNKLRTLRQSSPLRGNLTFVSSAVSSDQNKTIYRSLTMPPTDSGLTHDSVKAPYPTKAPDSPFNLPLLLFGHRPSADRIHQP